VKAGWIVASAMDGAAAVLGQLPAGLRPGTLGQLKVPAIEQKPNVGHAGRVTPCHSLQESGAMSATGDTLQTAGSGT
jgi:hypothetical protein